MDTGNKAFVQFNENSHNCVYSLKLEIKLKKKYFRPTYPIFFHNVSGNTTFSLYGLMSFEAGSPSLVPSALSAHGVKLSFLLHLYMSK
jgi:hypothetical protein